MEKIIVPNIPEDILKEWEKNKEFFVFEENIKKSTAYSCSPPPPVSLEQVLAWNAEDTLMKTLPLKIYPPFCSAALGYFGPKGAALAITSPIFYLA